MKFREQAEQHLNDLAGEARQNTLATYRSILNARVLPILGEEDLASIDSATAKSLKERLVKDGLSPATIGLAVWLLKKVVESATDSRGNRLYRPNWNNDFIRLPKRRPTVQRTPITPVEAISRALQTTSGPVKVLIALLGGSGLRIGEALALGVGSEWAGNLWDPQAGTLTIRATRVHGRLQEAPKTDAGDRTVDLDPTLNAFMVAEFGSITGSMFPQSKDTYDRRLKEAGILGGFHGLRRRRLTDLQLQDVPRALISFWAGHAAGDITERYAKVGSEIAVRKAWSEKAGLGFQL